MASEKETFDAAAEIERLRLRQESVTDEDVFLAIQGQIDSLEASLHTPKVVEASEESEESESLVDDTSPELIAKAERLLREANLEKVRGKREAARRLLKQATDTAPNSAVVLLAVGDDYLELGKYADAKAVLGRAKKLDPKNPTIERKYAEAVLGSGGNLSIDAQLRAGLSDSPLLTTGDAVASLKAARMLNMVFPGVGQLALGQSKIGFILVGCWVGCILLIILMNKQVGELMRAAVGAPGHGSFVAMVPIFLALVVYFAAQGMLTGKSESIVTRQKVDHPEPPVNLPFD